MMESRTRAKHLYHLNMKKRTLILAAALTMVCGLASAQSSDLGNWFIYFGTGKINAKWSIWAETQYRNYNFVGDLEQFLVRTAAMYQVAEGASISQGYAFVLSNPYDAQGDRFTTIEHRPYQQLLLRQRFGRVYLAHRYRVEERILEDDFRLRFRYFFSINYCLNKPSLEKGAVYLAAYDEIFLHTDKPLYDRNRLYGSVGYVFSPNLRMEAGIMGQMLEKRTRSQLQIVLHHNFQLGKS